jgi:hypothetical protein
MSRVLVCCILGTLGWASLSLGAEPLPGQPGWKLSAIDDEENVYQEAGLFLLEPPDGRPSITVRDGVAARIRSGSLRPEEAYRRGGRPVTRPEIATEGAQGKEAPGVQGDATGGFARLSGRSVGGLEESPSPAVVQAPAAVARPPWNPDGKTKPIYVYEENVAACSGSRHPGLWPHPPWELPPAKTDFACRKKDVDERLRRAAYDLCSSEEARKIGKLDLGGVREVWATDLQNWHEGGEDSAVAQGLIFCNKGEPYRAVFVLRQYRQQCWTCGYQAGTRLVGYDTELEQSQARKAIRAVDLRGGPRTSPNESEPPDRDAYWNEAP